MKRNGYPMVTLAHITAVRKYPDPEIEEVTVALDMAPSTMAYLMRRRGFETVFVDRVYTRRAGAVGGES